MAAPTAAPKADDADASKTKGTATADVPQPTDGHKEGEDPDKEKEPTPLEKEVGDQGFWSSVGNTFNGFVKGVEVAWDQIPSAFGDAKVTPAVATTGDQVNNPAVKPVEQNNGWLGALGDGLKAGYDFVKSGVDAVSNAVSESWKSVFGQGATTDVTDTNKDGKADKVVVTEKEGDVITSDGKKTTIEKKDGTRVTRENGETTVEKDGMKITRDAHGVETYTLKDGSTGRIGADGNMDVKLKALHEQITKDGVYGEIETEGGLINRTYFNTTRDYNALTREQRDRDIVNAGDQTVMRVDKENGIHASFSKKDGDRTATFTKEGSNEVVQVGIENGQRVLKVGKLGADGKPDESSFKTVSADGIPDWFKQHSGRHCHGQTPGTVGELMDGAGVKVVNGAIVVKEDNMTAGRTATGAPVVDVQRGTGEQQHVILTNDKGNQTVNDVEHKQVTTWDGHNYSEATNGVTQIRLNPESRHLQLYDERGNLFADSTRAGTSVAGGYIGADGSYTGSDGRRYFTGTAQEMQFAASASQVALAGAEGHITNFRGQLANKGTPVDIGELASSMGSLTEALALCLKSGNFTNLGQIIGSMGQVQDLIAQGTAHNADVLTIKAAVPGATDLQIASTKPGPNDASVAQLDRMLHEKNQRASA